MMKFIDSPLANKYCLKFLCMKKLTKIVWKLTSFFFSEHSYN